MNHKGGMPGSRWSIQKLFSDLLRVIKQGTADSSGFLAEEGILTCEFAVITHYGIFSGRGRRGAGGGGRVVRERHTERERQRERHTHRKRKT